MMNKKIIPAIITAAAVLLAVILTINYINAMNDLDNYKTELEQKGFNSGFQEGFDKGWKTGIARGFDQGFISGQAYEQGNDILHHRIDGDTIIKTWYTWAGFYEKKDGLNPYRDSNLSSRVIMMDHNGTITEYENPYMSGIP